MSHSSGVLYSRKILILFLRQSLVNSLVGVKNSESTKMHGTDVKINCFIMSIETQRDVLDWNKKKQNNFLPNLFTTDFDILLTVHLNVFILILTNLMY